MPTLPAGEQEVDAEKHRRKKGDDDPSPAPPQPEPEPEGTEQQRCEWPSFKGPGEWVGGAGSSAAGQCCGASCALVCPASCGCERTCPQPQSLPGLSAPAFPCNATDGNFWDHEWEKHGALFALQPALCFLPLNAPAAAS